MGAAIAPIAAVAGISTIANWLFPSESAGQTNPQTQQTLTAPSATSTTVQAAPQSTTEQAAIRGAESSEKRKRDAARRGRAGLVSGLKAPEALGGLGGTPSAAAPTPTTGVGGV